MLCPGEPVLCACAWGEGVPGDCSQPLSSSGNWGAYGSVGSPQDGAAGGWSAGREQWGGRAWRRGCPGQRLITGPAMLQQGTVGGGFCLWVFCQELKEPLQFLSCPRCLPTGRGLLGVPRCAELMGRGMHAPHLPAKHPAREHGSPGQDLPRDQWEVSDLWEQQHKM